MLAPLELASVGVGGTCYCTPVVESGSLSGMSAWQADNRTKSEYSGRLLEPALELVRELGPEPVPELEPGQPVGLVAASAEQLVRPVAVVRAKTWATSATGSCS